jgi:hypothetical protein
MPDRPPSPLRLVAAFFLAAAAAPLPFALGVAVGTPDSAIDLALMVMLFGFPLALLHVLLLALPAYLLLRRRWPVTWANSAVLGLLIGALPTAVLSEGLTTLASTGACGLVGGLVFRMVLRPAPPAAESEELRDTFA